MNKLQWGWMFFFILAVTDRCRYEIHDEKSTGHALVVWIDGTWSHTVHDLPMLESAKECAENHLKGFESCVSSQSVTVS
jgi:hypothetical protein